MKTMNTTDPRVPISMVSKNASAGVATPVSPRQVRRVAQCDTHRFLRFLTTERPSDRTFLSFTQIRQSLGFVAVNLVSL